MRPSRFTDDEITQALRQIDAGTPAVEMWQKKHGASVPTGRRSVRELRTENLKLKEIVANLLLDRLP